MSIPDEGYSGNVLCTLRYPRALSAKFGYPN